MPEPQPQPSPKEERIGKYRVHPVAALFPMMQGEEFDDLVESIRSCNQKIPIVVDKDVLLDGRNRLKACLQLDIPPRVEQYHPVRNEDPGEWILMMNIHRRHLTPQQRAMLIDDAYDVIKREAIARRAAAGVLGKEHGKEGGRGHKKPLVVNSPQGVPEPKTRIPSIRVQIAKKEGISEHVLRQVNEVKKYAPELKDAVTNNTIKLKDAAKQAHAKHAAATPPKPKPQSKPQPTRADIQKAMDKGLKRAITYFEKERDQLPESLHAEFTREFIETVKKL